MKKNIFLILLTALLCLPLLAGFSIISILALGSFLTYTFVRNSAKSFAVSAVTMLLCMALIFRADIPTTLSFSMPVILVSYLLGTGISKKQSFQSVIISAVIAAIAAITIILLYNTHITNKTAFSLLFGEFTTVMKDTLAGFGISTQYIDEFLVQLELMLPSIIIVSASLCVYVIFGISRTVLERKGYIIENMPHFSELHLNRSFTSVFLVIFLFSLFGGMSAVSLNIITVVVTLFSVCGLSVCVYYLKKFGLPKAVRVIIYVAAVILLPFTAALGGIPTVLMFGLGIFDSYRSLRREE